MTTEKTTIAAKSLIIDPPLVVDCAKLQMKQNWAIISFISPEDRIKCRFIYEANRFLYTDVNKQLADTTINLTRNINIAFRKNLESKVSKYKSSDDPTYQATAELLSKVMDEIVLNEEEEMTRCLRSYKLDQQELLDRFEVYKTQNTKELESDFNLQFGSETSIRGVKVRGVFEDLADARKQAEKLRNEYEPNIHAFVIPVGYWCPWDPSADAIQDQQHMVPELNDLMEKYNRNVEERNQFYEKRKQMLMESASASNQQNNELHDRLKQRLAEKKNQRNKK